MLQHIIRHSFAEREAGSWLPTETAQTRNRSQQLSPEKAECPLPCTESVARRTPQHSQGTEPTPSRRERCATGQLAMEVCRNCAFSDVCRWQDIDAIRSQAPGDDEMLARCALRHPTVAIFSCDAFSGVLPWQDSAAVRSRASIRGRFCAPRIPKAASDGKIASSWQDSRAMHPKRAGFGKMCAPCIRKAPQIAVGGYTARRSCQEGALFAARAPRIMHGAQILPSFGA